MASFSIENLFCCPICKSPLIYESGTFTCSFCGEKFSKRGDIYDFRVKIDVRDKKQRDKFEQLILRNEPSQWLAIVLKHLSQVEYSRILLDPHLKEIDEYINKLVEKGVDVGKRYDSMYVPQSSIRDLHVAIALRYVRRINDKGIALDLGCGTLRVTKELLKRGFQKIVAIDLLPEVMSYGYRKLNNEDKGKVVLVRADVRFLPLKECSIDFVFSLELFEHIDAPLLLLLDLKRVLKKDGVAVINTWNALEIRSRKIMKQKGKSYYENGFFYKFCNLKELEMILKEVDIDFALKPHGCYLERRLLNVFGNKFLKPLALVDNLLSFFLPQFLFHHLIFRFQKRNSSKLC